MNKFFKKAFSLFMAAAICPVVSLNASASEVTFEDISGHWAENDIKYLYKAGLVSGMSETEFAPDKVISKAEFITMLIRALGIPTDLYSVNFSDVAPLDDWFAGFLGGAVNAKIIDDSVHPVNPLMNTSRGEVAVMLKKAMRYSGVRKVNKETAFTDVSADDAELYEAVEAVSSVGIMVGETETEFAPGQTLTRAEAAAVVKRMSLAAQTINTVGLSLTSSEVLSEATEEDGIITFEDGFSYAALGEVDFHYDINMLKVSAAVSDDDLKLEIWLDSLNTLTGTKVGTVILEKTASMESYTGQTALISRSYGSRKVYLRLVGNGEAKLKSAEFVVDELPLSITGYSEIYLMKKNSGTLTNLKVGGYVNYNEVDFGNKEGYDTIEFDMKNSIDGQLFEIWFGNDKAAVLETESSGDEGITISTPIIKANGVKNVSIKPLTSGEGSITGIRFYNSRTKADLMFNADDAETELAIQSSNDYDGENETETMSDGDVIKFSNVNFSDGYNFLSMRMREQDYVMGGAELYEGETAVGTIMGSIVDYEDEDAYIEVRLDSETGPVIGKLRENPIPVNSEYDIQSCELYGATGIHDLYLKAVGNIGWNMKYIKLQERGWYDSPFRTYEAEDMEVYKGTVTDPLSPERYTPRSITGESSGRANVLIEENGGYVEFTVPGWFEGKENRTALNVRHSMTDYINEEGKSVGQKGKMKISINGEEIKPLDSFNNFEPMDYLTLSNEYSIGYSAKSGSANGLVYVEDGASSFLLDDNFCILPGTIKPGDVIRLEPEINESVTYCYIDCIEIENIEDAKEKPERFLSIADCGAIPNDGLDDAEALRAAIEKVKENPYTYDGVWIPEGNFEMMTYVGNGGQTADFTGVRVLGSGIWTSRLMNMPHTRSGWTANYSSGDGTVVRDLAFIGVTRSRNWNFDDAICFNGIGMHHIDNVWVEHYNCAFWIKNGSGVYENLRMKNTWADGINCHNTSDGIIYANSFGRANGDDPFVIYSSNTTTNGVQTLDLVQDVQIKNCTAHSTWHASSITIWGGKDIDILNNLVRDACNGAGISLNAWGWGTCGTEDVWILNNRIERSGSITSDGQPLGPISIVPGTIYEGCNNKYIDTYFENNEFIDNPYLMMRISSQSGADEVLFDVNYNYVRNTGLAYTDDSSKAMIEYLHSATHGELNYFYNVYEGDYHKFKTTRSSANVVENLVGNLPEEWGT